MAQQLTAQGVRMIEAPFVPKNLSRAASALLTTFRTSSIDLYPHAELVRDLKHLNIESRPFGYRIVAPKTADGHCDAAIALSIPLAELADGVARGPVPESYERISGNVLTGWGL